MPLPTLLVIVGASLIRLFIAFHVPLTEDETYYWAWSRRLAFGYTDHPPMVAWLIALSAPLGSSPGIVRLPFIVCETLTALVLYRTTLLLGGDARAGSAAAIAFTLIPQVRLDIAEALPDGPYLLCWALSLMLTARIATGSQTRHGPKRTALPDIFLLGAALGGALLSRFFGWALLAGIVAFTFSPRQRALWRQGFWIAPLLALVIYAPFIAWNATHGWVNLTFTVRDRQSFEAFSLAHLNVLSTTRFLIYAIILWSIGFLVTLRSQNALERLQPHRALIAWTALPFTTLLMLLSFCEVVESYWLLGPFTSLCVGIGIAYAQSPLLLRRILRLFWIPAACTLASALFLTLGEPLQISLLQVTSGALRGWYSPVFVYRRFAHDITTLSRKGSAAALTDRFEIASELTYYGLDPLLIGASPQVGQWLQWHDPQRIPERALIITSAPLDQSEPLVHSIQDAYASVRPGPVLTYRYASSPAMTFHTTWCSKPRANAANALYYEKRKRWLVRS